MKRIRRFTLAVVLGSLAVSSIPPLAASAAEDGPDGGYTFIVEGENARMNRLVTGEVVAELNGVPAEPVDSFVWDGEGSVPIDGSVKITVDPVANTGEITATWTDENGVWEYSQTTFAPPSHPTGLRIGSAGASTELVEGDPVVTNVYLHGDTTAGGAVLPTVFNLLATWGPATVTLNGEPFENPFDGPAPQWAAHTMTTVGVRDDDGIVRTVDGDIFDAVADPSNGAVDNDDLEVHLVIHDDPGPDMTANFPPPMEFWVHLIFEDVAIQIAQS
ncbi:MAG: hypothetical protein ACC726_16000 [Chloroflexota bacterium]